MWCTGFEFLNCTTSQVSFCACAPTTSICFDKCYQETVFQPHKSLQSDKIAQKPCTMLIISSQCFGLDFGLELAIWAVSQSATSSATGSGDARSARNAMSAMGATRNAMSARSMILAIQPVTSDVLAKCGLCWGLLQMALTRESTSNKSAIILVDAAQGCEFCCLTWLPETTALEEELVLGDAGTAKWVFSIRSSRQCSSKERSSVSDKFKVGLDI